MLRGVEYKFTDADRYQESVRAANVELLLSEKGQFSGALTQIDFEKVWLQRGRENLARIARIGLSSERVAIFFTSSQNGQVYSNGVELRPSQVVAFEPGQEIHQRSRGKLEWGSFSLASAHLAKLGLAHLIPRGSVIRTPEPRTLVRLHDLHSAAGKMLRSRSPAILLPAPAYAFEQALTETYLACLFQSDSQRDRHLWRKRTQVIRRLEAWLEANQGRPLYMLEICAALKIEERTLQLYFRDCFGMSPTQYLRLRRMHLARRALKDSDSTVTSVTEIAIRYGFWELGRFAVRYRRLFGEPPSETLRRAS